MIQRYDEDVVKTLMPLLVNVLECLDSAYQSNQEHEVEVELLREDNEQLVTQYEREKSARKQSEQKLLDTEDLAETENKELAGRLEALESIARMLELKHKNSMEHANRLEEREGETKKEYAKLHDRYTELFKTHVDYMERTKLLMSSTHSQMSSVSERNVADRSRLHPMYRLVGRILCLFGFFVLVQIVSKSYLFPCFLIFLIISFLPPPYFFELKTPLTARYTARPTHSFSPIFRSSGPVSYGFASLETSQMLDTETVCSVGNSSNDSGSGPPSLQNEFDNIQTMERSAETDNMRQTNQATSPNSEQAPSGPTTPVTPTHATGLKIYSSYLLNWKTFDNVVIF